MVRFRPYTGSGDDGSTYNPAMRSRVPKDHVLVELSGTLDEAVSAVGLARSFLPEKFEDVDSELSTIQRMLFAAVTTLQSRGSRVLVGEGDVRWLESVAENRMEDVQLFVVPSGHPASTALHVARAAVRRLERTAVKASREEDLDQPVAIKLLNRASSALFALAVHVNRRTGSMEEIWKP